MRKPTRRPISGEEEHFLLEFAHFLSGVRSPASIAAYQSDIRLFAENTPGVNLLRITAAQEDDYLARLKGLGFKRRTLGRKGTAFRYFHQFLSRKRLITERLNPVTELNVSVDRKPGTKHSAFTEQNEIDEALSAFMLYVGENRSQATVRAYTCDLLKFHDCLGNTAKWHQVTKQLISDFLDQQITGRSERQFDGPAALHDPLSVSMAATERPHHRQSNIVFAGSARREDGSHSVPLRD